MVHTRGVESSSWSAKLGAWDLVWRGSRRLRGNFKMGSGSPGAAHLPEPKTLWALNLNLCLAT